MNFPPELETIADDILASENRAVAGWLKDARAEAAKAVAAIVSAPRFSSDASARKFLTAVETHEAEVGGKIHSPAERLVIAVIVALKS